MPFSMSGNSNWSYNRFDAFEAQYKKTEEPKGRSRGCRGRDPGRRFLWFKGLPKGWRSQV